MGRSAPQALEEGTGEAEKAENVDVVLLDATNLAGETAGAAVEDIGSEMAGEAAQVDYVVPAAEGDTFAVLAAAFGAEGEGEKEIPLQERKLVRISPYSLVREDRLPATAKVMPHMPHQRRSNAVSGSSSSHQAASTAAHPCELLDPYLKDGAGKASNGN